jgi:hypothetical protein
MYFGNSRVTIRKSANCDFYGITDKSFVVSFINGWVKDDVFFAYAKSCLGFEGWQSIVDLNYICLNNEFCSGLSAPDEATPTVGVACDEIVGSLTGSDVYIIENSFDNIGIVPTISPFCTLDANWHENDCQCPQGYTKSEESYGETCFKIFPIETIGLNFTDEIDPCKFLFISKQIGEQIEYQNTTVSVYYKTYNESGTEVCNVATFQVQPDPCSDIGVSCWPPPFPEFPLIPTPDGDLVGPCEYCEEYGDSGGDVCYFEGLAIASSTCECPYTLTCYSEDWAEGSSGNCFFAPGITTTEPCINGSWNGASCADGYNDVCASTDCVDKICKELDWFIQNYGRYYNDSFRGYSSFVSTIGGQDESFTGPAEEWYVSCGPTGVSAIYEIGDIINVTFGENASTRNWSNVVGILNYFTRDYGVNTGKIYDHNLGTTTIDYSIIGGTSCGWFYPMNLCCPPVPEGAFDYDCPMCGPSGFTTHSPVETSCCCAKNMIPIVFGLNNQTGFDSAATGISSIGIQPSFQTKG